MNKKHIICFYLLLITIIVLFVPFQYSLNLKTIHGTEYYGYSFLFKPPVKIHEITATEDPDIKEFAAKFNMHPKPIYGPDTRWKTEIIYPRIGLELIAVSAICGILYLNAKNKE